MSETQLIAERMEIRQRLNTLKDITSLLYDELTSISDLEDRVTAIIPSHDPEMPWRVAEQEDTQANLRIFSQFSYTTDQDPREARKFPAVIQLHPTRHQSIAQLLTEINQHKDALHQSNKTLKAIVGKQAAEVWQEIQTFASIIQILRHVSVLDDEGFTYLGLSYMVKPVVKCLDKRTAIQYIDDKINFCTSRSAYMNKLPFLDDVRQQLEGVDEREFEIKMARKGAPRYMVNAKSQSRNYQVMASLPVFVFTPDTLKVSLPSGRKRKQRRDKRIPLGEVKSEFGLYLIPKVKGSNIVVTD